MLQHPGNYIRSPVKTFPERVYSEAHILLCVLKIVS